MTRALPHSGRTASVSPAGENEPAAVLAAVEAHARSMPGKVALAEVGPDGEPACRITFAELAARASGLARMIADAAPPQAVVMLVGPSGPDLGAWLLGAVKAGVLALPLPSQSTPAEIGDLARRSGAVAIVSRPCPELEHLQLTRIEWDAALHAQDLRSAAAADRSIPRHRPGSIVLHSSGTTGLSKLAVRDMPALDADAANVALATRLTADDCVLMTTPLSHSYGVDLLLASLLTGSSLHTTREFDVGAIASHLAKHATVFPGVPFAIEALGRLGDQPPASRLRLAFSAGAALPERVRTSFQQAWGVRVGDLYGSSELGTVTFNDPTSPGYLAGSVGPGLPGVSIRIVHPDDPSRELPTGQEGHVAISAPSMLSRYLDGDVPLAAGRLLTGDLGRLDHARRLTITGRLKLLIDAGGIKVNPLEVEAILNLHPGVAESVVVPLHVSGTVSRLRAVFVARDPRDVPTAEHLRAFLRERLSAPRVPRVFECVASLPRSATGKILRSALTEPSA